MAEGRNQVSDPFALGVLVLGLAIAGVMVMIVAARKNYDDDAD